MTTIKNTKRTDSLDKRLEAVQEILVVEISPTDYTIYTNRSVTDGVENGRAGAFIFRGGTELMRIWTPVGCWTSN